MMLSCLCTDGETRTQGWRCARAQICCLLSSPLLPWWHFRSCRKEAQAALPAWETQEAHWAPVAQGGVVLSPGSWAFVPTSRGNAMAAPGLRAPRLRELFPSTLVPVGDATCVCWQGHRGGCTSPWLCRVQLFLES